MSTKEKNIDYVNNKDFYNAIVERKKQLETNPDIPISNYLAECIIRISRGVTMRDNFKGYRFRDEMEHAAVENCVRYFDKYNPEVNKNAFGYYSRICWNACVRKLKEEKKAYAVKLESTMEYIRIQGKEKQMTSSEKEYLSYARQWLNDFNKSLDKEREKTKNRKITQQQAKKAEQDKKENEQTESET